MASKNQVYWRILSQRMRKLSLGALIITLSQNDHNFDPSLSPCLHLFNFGNRLRQTFKTLHQFSTHLLRK